MKKSTLALVVMGIVASASVQAAEGDAANLLI